MASNAIGNGLRRQAYGAYVAVLFGAVTVKYFFFTSGEDVAAFAGSFGAFTAIVLSFIGVTIGIQRFRGGGDGPTS